MTDYTDFLLFVIKIGFNILFFRMLLFFGLDIKKGWGQLFCQLDSFCI